jgi:hypothetical protein
MAIVGNRRKNMADAKEAEADLWDQMVMDGVNGDTKMLPDAIFVREYVRHGDEVLAVSRAGLTDSRYSLNVIADYHLSRPEIQSAISIQRELVKENEALKRRLLGGYSRELILEDLETLHLKAREDGDYAPAISAKKVQAQVLGYLDKTVHVTHSLVPREMTTDELRLRIAEMTRDSLPPPAEDVPAIIEGEFTEVGDAAG